MQFCPHFLQFSSKFEKMGTENFHKNLMSDSGFSWKSRSEDHTSLRVVNDCEPILATFVI
jgi:hypothetical protein